MSGGKRKLEDTGKEVKVLEAENEVGLKPKKQRLMTDFHMLVDQQVKVDLSLPEE